MPYEPLAPAGNEVVRPYLNQRNRYTPRVDDMVTIDIPGQKIRAKIEAVVDNDYILCTLLSVPIGGISIGFAKGDLVNARRATGDHGVEIWKSISEHELQQQEARSRLEAEQQRLDDAAAHERVAAIRERDFAAKAAAEARAAQAEADRLPPPDGSNWSA